MSGQGCEEEGVSVKFRLLSFAAALCLSSALSAQEIKPEPELVRQMLQEGWTKVAEGVLQRTDGQVETFTYGEDGLRWTARKLEARLELLEKEYASNPTEELAGVIESLESQLSETDEVLASGAAAAEVVSPDELADCSVSHSATAAADPETNASAPGAKANATAYFHANCSQIGNSYAYAYARATQGTVTTIQIQEDPKNDSSWADSAASASAPGNADCFSEAYGRAWSPELNISYEVSDTNYSCSNAHSYFAVAPCRILDTRNSTILTNAQSRVVNIAGLCGIPSTAKAVSFNVTAVSPTGSGKFRLFPGDLAFSWPGPPSSITFAPATSPRANSAVIELATNGTGTLGIYPEVAGSPGQVHLVLDVQGYFSTDTTPAPGAEGPLGFQTVPICRMAWPSSPLAAGTVNTFTAQGVCGVPVGAAAASLHVGVAQPNYSGFVTLYPSNIATPGVSTLNFNSGILVLRNGAWVKLSPTTPDIAAYISGSTPGTTAGFHLDVNGYFKSDAPLKYHPITPCRPVSSVLLTTDTVSTFQIQGNCGVPVGTKAALVRLVVSGPTSAGDLTVYPSNLPLSGVAVSTVKFDANEPGLSMGTIVPLSTLTNDLAASAGEMTAGGTVVLSIDVFGYFR